MMCSMLYTHSSPRLVVYTQNTWPVFKSRISPPKRSRRRQKRLPTTGQNESAQTTGTKTYAKKKPGRARVHRTKTTRKNNNKQRDSEKSLGLAQVHRVTGEPDS